MTFNQLAQFVASNAAADGDSSFKIPISSPYFATSFGTRIAFLLRQFTMDVPLLFATMEPITIEEGDSEFVLTDPANCSKAFNLVHRLWIKGQEIPKAESAGAVLAFRRPNDTPGAPTTFAHITESKLIFDRTVSEDIEDCYAQGFYRHAAITSDDDPVEPEVEDNAILFDRYCQANLRQDVAGDEVGLQRLARVDKQSFDALMRIRGRRMKAILDARRPH